MPLEARLIRTPACAGALASGGLLRCAHLRCGARLHFDPRASSLRFCSWWL